MILTTRREILRTLTMLPLGLVLPKALYAAISDNRRQKKYPTTIDVLKSAYLNEMNSHMQYKAFVGKARGEGYANIAYLFKVFSVSNKMHAKNYKNILVKLDVDIKATTPKFNIRNTKTNLYEASAGELEKIEKLYPQYLKRLAIDSYTEAVVNCMWAWKSHRRHEEHIADIHNYTSLFFPVVAQRLEAADFNFHVCKICGTTVSKPPELPCETCNYPAKNYVRIPPPA